MTRPCSVESCFELQQSGFMGFVAKLSTFQLESLRDGHLQESKSLLLTRTKTLTLLGFEGQWQGYES